MTAERARPVSQDSRLAKDAPSTNQNAALRGASLAFGKPPVKPKPQIDSYPGKNGALVAATKVGAGSRASSRSTSTTTLGKSADTQQLAYQQTGDSNVSRSYTGNSERGNPRMTRADRIGSGFLQPPGNAPEPSKSPSFIAATLAASRSASISPNPTGQQRLSTRELRRQSSFTRRLTSSMRNVSPSSESFDQALDTTPIPPTTSLIGLFEQNAVSPQTIRRPANRRSATTASMKLSAESQRPKSPLPVRTRTPPPLISPKPRKPEIKSPKPLLATLARNFEPLEPPLPLSAAKPPITAAKPIPITSTSISHKATGEEDNASSDDSFVSASDYKPSFRASLQHQNRKLTSPSAVSVNSSVTIDSLANAIVASSLASSRAASPSKSLSTSLYPPPPPPSRRSPRGHLFHNSKEISRTPSPAKTGGLRTTMRKPKPEEDVDEGEKRRSKKSLMKKHPNKHHEGDRKRWRDEITERERKRYEAVWASNKGLYTSSFPDSETSVCSLVARDIYSRSRLHTDVLEEVYALVDRRKDGRLEKEEFVVGLWLIDQRLKGRKLPPRISDFVWRSVGILAGIKVKKAGK